MAVAADRTEVSVGPGLDEVHRLARDHTLVPLRHTFVDDCETPVAAYLKLRGGGPSFLLESAEQGGQLVFSMLAWPGWTAELEGEPLSVTRSDAGLLTVTLPAGARGTVDLTHRPPGLTVGLLGAGVGGVIGLVLALVGWRSWRRRRAVQRPWVAPERGPLEPRDDVTTVSDASPATP